MRWLTDLLGIADATPAERRATSWTALMFFVVLASTFVLRPIRDQFGVDSGVERMGYLYTLTLLVTAVFLPGFWWLANRMASRRFVPIVLQVCAGCTVLLFMGLQLVGDYDWRAPGAQWVGEVFWGTFSALNVALPSLVWIHAVEHFRRDQGLRLFGLVGVGGTLGAIAGSQLAQWLTQAGLPPSSAAIATLVMLQLAFVCYRCSARACAAMVAERESAQAPLAGAAPEHDRPARGGVWRGAQLLVRDPYLLQIAGYMMLLGVVATAFYAVQTELVGQQIERGSDQARLLSEVEKWGQGLVLVLQLCVTGRLLRRLHPALFLCLLPLLSVFGLLSLWMFPAVLVLCVVQALRRGSKYALEKPSREVLFTPLSLETKYKTKFLLDTFALRLGDLLGAWLQVGLYGFGVGWALATTVVIGVLWGALAWSLGVRSARAAAAGAAPAVSPG